MATLKLGEFLGKFISEMGFMGFFTGDGYLNAIMIIISFVLLYLAIVKKYEPLLLLPIAFGMLLTNLPFADLYNGDLWVLHEGHVDVGNVITNGGLLDLLYLGVKLGIYPPLIFLGVGAMTDFGPLIANPKSLLLGAAASAWNIRCFLWRDCSLDLILKKRHQLESLVVQTDQLLYLQHHSLHRDF